MHLTVENTNSNLAQSVSLINERVTTPYVLFNVNSLMTTRSSNSNLNNYKLNLSQWSEYYDEKWEATDSFHGYNIYRSSVSPVVLNDSIRLNITPLNTNSYIDSTLDYSGTFYYTVTAIYVGGELPANEVLINITSSESQDLPILPKEFSIAQNHPNPFNPSTKIKFALPKPETVTIEVYNIIGQKIQTLLNKPMPAGYHEVDFNGQNLSSGVYLYRIQAGAWQDVKKMVYIK
jgi:hypothetical protein